MLQIITSHSFFKGRRRTVKAQVEVLVLLEAEENLHSHQMVDREVVLQSLL